MIVNNFNNFSEQLSPLSKQKNFMGGLKLIEYNIIPYLYDHRVDNEEESFLKLFPKSSWGISSNNKFCMFSPTFGYWECNRDLNRCSIDDFRSDFYSEYMSRILSKSKFFQFYWAASLGSNMIRCFEGEELKVEVYSNWIYVHLCDKHLKDDAFTSGLLDDIYRLRRNTNSYFSSDSFNVINNSILRYFDTGWMLSVGAPTRGHIHTAYGTSYLIDNNGVIHSNKDYTRIYNNFKEIGFRV